MLEGTYGHRKYLLKYTLLQIWTTEQKLDIKQCYLFGYFLSYIYITRKWLTNPVRKLSHSKLDRSSPEKVSQELDKASRTDNKKMSKFYMALVSLTKQLFPSQTFCICIVFCILILIAEILIKIHLCTCFLVKISVKLYHEDYKYLKNIWILYWACFTSYI